MKLQLKGFFEYARERYLIFLKKEAGQQKPWTKDPVLQKYSFCNVFREDDKTTKWFRENYRQFPTATAFGCVAFRFFNRISTGEILVKENLLNDWSTARVRKALKDVHPLISGAYIIRGPNGYNKLEAIIRVLNPIWKDQQKGKFDLRGMTLEAAHKRLCEYDFLGPFMAYEGISDIRYTSILNQATDIMTWASAGPGAARGLARMLGKPLNTFNHGREKDRAEMVVLMREILAASQDFKYWPKEWPSWEMRTSEHSLCEYDKIERVRNGEGRPKARYQGV